MAEKIYNLEAEINDVKRVETFEEVFDRDESQKSDNTKEGNTKNEVKEQFKQNTKHSKEPYCDVSVYIFENNISIIMQKKYKNNIRKTRSFVFSESMLDEFEP